MSSLRLQKRLAASVSSLRAPHIPGERERQGERRRGAARRRASPARRPPPSRLCFGAATFSASALGVEARTKAGLEPTRFPTPRTRFARRPLSHALPSLHPFRSSTAASARSGWTPTRSPRSPWPTPVSVRVGSVRACGGGERRERPSAAAARRRSACGAPGARSYALEPRPARPHAESDRPPLWLRAARVGIAWLGGPRVRGPSCSSAAVSGDLFSLGADAPHAAQRTRSAPACPGRVGQGMFSA